MHHPAGTIGGRQRSLLLPGGATSRSLGHSRLLEVMVAARVARRRLHVSVSRSRCDKLSAGSWRFLFGRTYAWWGHSCRVQPAWAGRTFLGRRVGGR